jgi:hypothetical protein
MQALTKKFPDPAIEQGGEDGRHDAGQRGTRRQPCKLADHAFALGR